MKFAVIYKLPMCRTRSIEVEADSFDDLLVKKMDLNPNRLFVEHIVDFEGQRIIPAAMTSEGMLIEVPDGDFGERTPAEYFLQAETLEIKE